ncbi:plastid ribosomal protein L35, partial [Scenedesmus sp. NREL 46B-D3]
SLCSQAQRAFSSRSSAFVASPVAPVRRVVLAAVSNCTVEVEAKLKTRKAAAKRIRVTGSGKLVARHSGKQHMNEKQTRAQKRELSKSFVLEGADMYRASRCLP